MDGLVIQESIQGDSDDNNDLPQTLLIIYTKSDM